MTSEGARRARSSPRPRRSAVAFLALAGFALVPLSCTPPKKRHAQDEPRTSAAGAPSEAGGAAADTPRANPPETSKASVPSAAPTAPEVASTASSAPPAAAPASQPSGAATPQAEATGVFQRKEADWPMWGGTPARNMVCPLAMAAPTSWDVATRKNIRWSAPLGSRSHGNPVVSGGKVFVGTNNAAPRDPKVLGDKGILLCLDASDGQLLWQAVHDKLETGAVNDRPEQGICSSPCVEQNRVYYVSNRAELICADIDGYSDGENDGPYTKEKYSSPTDADFIWVLDMMEDLGVFPNAAGASSPLIVNDLVYVLTSNGADKDRVTIPAPNAPSFIAVHKLTGEVVWSRNDPGDKILPSPASSPSFTAVGGRPQIIFPGVDGWVRAFEPLHGEPIWSFDGNPKDTISEPGGKGTRNAIVATAACADGHVYVGVGQDPEYGEGLGHLYSIDASKTGDVTESGRTWHVGYKDFRRTVSTVAVIGGLVYAVDLSGFLQCFDQANGTSYWTHDMLAAVRGSPLWVDDKIYLGDEDGDVAILQAGKELKVIAEISMGSSVHSTPVAAGGILYIASRTHLFAIQEEMK